MTLDQIDSINLTGAEIVVGSVIKGAAAPLADTKGINITLHNFAVSPMRMHDWQAESNLSSVTLALSGWKDPIAFHTGQVHLVRRKARRAICRRPCHGRRHQRNRERARLRASPGEF